MTAVADNGTFTTIGGNEGDAVGIEPWDPTAVPRYPHRRLRAAATRVVTGLPDRYLHRVA
ncbi:hypothetical protein [Nocardia sp. NBC_01329]|uniref:hypothetical protein n=1 Tax=Nocardia sp. NBC_01329 TaxID=2903594 RepID=UPI002E144FE1|nr:hypothetical protein OG405_01390 [Nocardia sp. NBC_01329]